MKLVPGQEYEYELIEIGGSRGWIFTQDLREYLGDKNATKIKIQTKKGKYGPYLAIFIKK